LIDIPEWMAEEELSQKNTCAKKRHSGAELGQGLEKSHPDPVGSPSKKELLVPIVIVLVLGFFSSQGD
jgi:hypothetical protein